MLWLPVLIVPQILFTAGVAWFLAALGVFVRDLGQIIGFLLTLWFFLTPICYPESSLPAMAAHAALEKSDLRAGARLPRRFPGRTRARVRTVVEAVDRLGRGLRRRARLVLQAAQIVRRYYLNQRDELPARITDALVSYGPWGVLLLAFLDSAGIPVSAGMDALIILVAVQTPGRAWLVAALAVVGSVAGNIVLFSAARKGRSWARKEEAAVAPGRTGPVRALVPRVRHDHDFRARRSAGDPAAAEGIRDLGGR